MEATDLCYTPGDRAGVPLLRRRSRCPPSRRRVEVLVLDPEGCRIEDRDSPSRPRARGREAASRRTRRSARATSSCARPAARHRRSVSDVLAERRGKEPNSPDPAFADNAGTHVGLVERLLGAVLDDLLGSAHSSWRSPFTPIYSAVTCPCSARMRSAATSNGSSHVLRRVGRRSFPRSPCSPLRRPRGPRRSPIRWRPRGCVASRRVARRPGGDHRRDVLLDTRSRPAVAQALE